MSSDNIDSANVQVPPEKMANIWSKFDKALWRHVSSTGQNALKREV